MRNFLKNSEIMQKMLCISAKICKKKAVIFEYLRQFILHIRSCQVFFSKLGWFHILLAKKKFSI